MAATSSSAGTATGRGGLYPLRKHVNRSTATLENYAAYVGLPVEHLEA
jgi:hypothetical protein